MRGNMWIPPVRVSGYTCCNLTQGVMCPPLRALFVPVSVRVFIRPRVAASGRSSQASALRPPQHACIVLWVSCGRTRPRSARLHSAPQQRQPRLSPLVVSGGQLVHGVALGGKHALQGSDLGLQAPAPLLHVPALGAGIFQSSPSRLVRGFRSRRRRRLQRGWRCVPHRLPRGMRGEFERSQRCCCGRHGGSASSSTRSIVDGSRRDADSYNATLHCPQPAPIRVCRCIRCSRPRRRFDLRGTPRSAIRKSLSIARGHSLRFSEGRTCGWRRGAEGGLRMLVPRSALSGAQRIAGTRRGNVRVVPMRTAIADQNTACGG